MRSAAAAATAGVVPIMFFVLAAALASMGPGNIATAALIAPMAMATAARAGIPLFLMAIMVGNGANAGVALAVCADRHHRQRPDGAHRSAGPRTADLSLQRLARTRSSRSAATSCSAGCKLFSGRRRRRRCALETPTASTAPFEPAATGSRSALIVVLLASVIFVIAQGNVRHRDGRVRRRRSSSCSPAAPTTARPSSGCRGA